MECKLFIYIFVLFVICTPKFLLKRNFVLQDLVYSAIFSLLFFFTYDLVVSIQKEGMDDYKIKVEGANHLSRFLKSFSNDNNQSKNISINNKIEGPVKEKVYSDSKTLVASQPQPELSTPSLPSSSLTPSEDKLINIDGGFPYRDGGFSKNQDYERYTRGWALSNGFTGSKTDCENLCNEQPECKESTCDATLYEQDQRCYCKFTPPISTSNTEPKPELESYTITGTLIDSNDSIKTFDNQPFVRLDFNTTPVFSTGYKLPVSDTYSTDVFATNVLKIRINEMEFNEIDSLGYQTMGKNNFFGIRIQVKNYNTALEVKAALSKNISSGSDITITVYGP